MRDFTNLPHADQDLNPASSALQYTRREIYVFPIYHHSKTHVFDTLVSPAVGRTDVRLLDDLDSLVHSEWVWPRTEFVRRMTQSLANDFCIESRKPNASPKLRFLSTILTSLFDRTQKDTSIFGRFWASRFQGDSCQEAFRQVKEWVVSPYRGDPPTFPLRTDEVPILSESFQPRVPRRSEVKPM